MIRNFSRPCWLPGLRHVRARANVRLPSPPLPRPGVPVWSFALDSGVATAIGIDGLDDLLPRDSSATIVRLRRLAGTIPEDSTPPPSAGYRL